MEQLGAGRLTCKESLGEEVIFTMQGIFWGRIQGFWLTHYLGEHTESFICFSGNLEKYKYERYWVLKVWKSQVNLSLYPDPYRNRAFINLIIQYIYLKKTRTHNIQKTIFFLFFLSYSFQSSCSRWNVLREQLQKECLSSKNQHNVFQVLFLLWLDLHKVNFNSNLFLTKETQYWKYIEEGEISFQFFY